MHIFFIWPHQICLFTVVVPQKDLEEEYWDSQTHQQKLQDLVAPVMALEKWMDLLVVNPNQMDLVGGIKVVLGAGLVRDLKTVLHPNQVALGVVDLAIKVVLENHKKMEILGAGVALVLEVALEEKQMGKVGVDLEEASDRNPVVKVVEEDLVREVVLGRGMMILILEVVDLVVVSILL